jgi:membrane associated rhomboid family serine protease
VIPLYDANPTRRRPVVTIALILVNVVVFVAEITAPDQVLRTTSGRPVAVDGFSAVTAEYGYVPCEATDQCRLGEDVVDFGPGVPPIEVPSHPVWLTVLASMFMHGGWLHLGGNMLFLWVFGNNVEDRLGRLRYLVFYLLGGIAADALQTAFDTSSAIPNIGASGAIAAVLGGYLLLFPRARVVTVIFIVFFFTILELPALIVLGLWFVQQALFGYFDLAQPSGGGGGVAYFAHIGGFVFGLLAIKLFANRARTARQSAWR